MGHVSHLEPDRCAQQPEARPSAFDLRLGVNALKVHSRREAQVELLCLWVARQLGAGELARQKLGGAARAEFVIPGVEAELGLDGAWVIGRRPLRHRPLAALPDPIPVDFYGEIAFRSARPSPDGRWHLRPQQPVGHGLHDLLPDRSDRSRPASACGTFPYGDKNTATVGGRYFFQPDGRRPADLPLADSAGHVHGVLRGEALRGALRDVRGSPDSRG